MNLEKVDRKFVNSIFDYCISQFGYSKYQRVLPRLILYNRPCRSEPENCGYYDYSKNVICIFKPSHRSCLDLVNTIVHEYVHYLQSEKKYYKLEKKHEYKDHPFEVEAYEIANKHGVLAKRYATKLLKK
jgi:hypothetical protein